jgi:hypothetical protein
MRILAALLVLGAAAAAAAQSLPRPAPSGVAGVMQLDACNAGSNDLRSPSMVLDVNKVRPGRARAPRGRPRGAARRRRFEARPRRAAWGSARAQRRRARAVAGGCGPRARAAAAAASPPGPPSRRPPQQRRGAPRSPCAARRHAAPTRAPTRASAPPLPPPPQGTCSLTTRVFGGDGSALRLAFPCEPSSGTRPHLSGPALNLWAYLAPSAAPGANATCAITTLSPSISFKRVPSSYYYGYAVSRLACAPLEKAAAAKALVVGSKLATSTEGRSGVQYGLWLVPELKPVGAC